MDGMKLNLGCGDRYAPEWTNVDFESPHPKDETVDLTGPLPWAAGSVTHVYAGHVLEHLTVPQCRDLLAGLLPCMDPAGGLLMIVGPDIPLAERMIADGTFDFTYHNLDSLRYGAGRWAGDVHQWECSAGAVAELCRDAGWHPVTDLGIRLVDQTWPVADREPQWQFAVRCYTGTPKPWVSP
jgi:hypothetical protein